MKPYLFLFLSIIFLTSCVGDNDSSYRNDTEQDIIQYITDNNLNATKTDSGLYYVINNEGTGDNPTESSAVNINYKGYFLDGNVFDENDGIILDLSGVIEGFKEGLQLFNEGGDGILIIPSELAYGDYGNSSGTIPGGSALIFEITLNVADYAAENEAAILQYIDDNDLDATRTDSGLYYVINNEGTGTKPTSTSLVTVAYKGTFLDGSVFDESTVSGTSFYLNQVIEGWTEGMQLFKEGGDGILLIPYHLAYGTYGYGSIPSVSVLVFDVTLVSVND
ncbi:FKBP-type peptidyl-prolyl cis-trans isomerase [Polaribacter sargassicola]|uniref:FKBP-type peptidyl-prolyl cis-trans isomerase n=1 Tax=Polaribacter sargassicola TaxID=2836891 RepID=UPI0027BAC165|nr:FKBP-type peptidyl-prolyl cis-trans isomerase [Polaribacter sp. DS7-9]MCG1035835.1 FKBP-type peptidyl-prolyl cis-trans isomerase [Polaribacter sp. DS7-9]